MRAGGFSSFLFALAIGIPHTFPEEPSVPSECSIQIWRKTAHTPHPLFSARYRRYPGPPSSRQRPHGVHLGESGFVEAKFNFCLCTSLKYISWPRYPTRSLPSLIFSTTSMIYFTLSGSWDLCFYIILYYSDFFMWLLSPTQTRFWEGKDHILFYVLIALVH